MSANERKPILPGPWNTGRRSVTGFPAPTREERFESSHILRGLVLVVEDEPDIANAICGVLRDEGYEVQAAGNGQDALNMLYVPPRPACIILDLMMPVMSGWQFRVEMKRHPSLANIPVIVLTAAVDGALYAQAEGMAFLKKPVDLDALLGAVKAFAG